MADSLEAARLFVSGIRYTGDAPLSETGGRANDLGKIRGLFYQNGLEIAPAVTPTLYERLKSACARLSLPVSSVSAFIYSSPEVQAECFGGGNDECVLRFSSALVDLLEEDEFEFVVGHELGHFLFQHREPKEERFRESPEYFLKRRAQEISVDRVGLLACASLDTALRALMKTVSGLTGRHLRFDVGSYISQLQKLESTPENHFDRNTHPSILIRSRALLWFSLSPGFSRTGAIVPKLEIQKIDERVERDLRRYVDGAVRQRIEQIKQDILMWLMAFEIVQHGTYGVSAQALVRKEFGEDTADRLRLFLCNTDQGELEELIYAKIREGRAQLEGLVPTSFMADMAAIERKIEERKNEICA